MWAGTLKFGVRWKTKPTHLATLLLGLYDDAGVLHGVVRVKEPSADRTDLGRDFGATDVVAYLERRQAKGREPLSQVRRRIGIEIVCQPCQACSCWS